MLPRQNREEQRENRPKSGIPTTSHGENYSGPPQHIIVTPPDQRKLQEEDKGEETETDTENLTTCTPTFNRFQSLENMNEDETDHLTIQTINSASQSTDSTQNLLETQPNTSKGFQVAEPGRTSG
ncbi:hypothetical protein Salat_1698400 [Sesamum alatum]|uniref:Uncharacterized protein n=1 Tax=Sesamum alatum TaxID=300844 RepID=A0AAE1Y7D8_9LAMI|nr:hypothetical protein Salat_1698400 [Sesamum alatum]